MALSRPASSRIDSVPTFIVVTDRALGLPGAFVRQVEQIRAAHTPAILLREKDLSLAEFSDLAHQVAEIFSGSTTQMYINIGNRDQATARIGVAREIGAAGIQIPGDSLPASEARRLAGSEMLIGLSIHYDNDRQGEWESADFLLAAPIDVPFDKPDAEAIGLERLGRLVVTSDLPIVALGGITPENAKSVLNTGVAGIAVRSPIWRSENTEELLGQYFSVMARFDRPVPEAML